MKISNVSFGAVLSRSYYGRNILIADLRRAA